MMNQGPERMIIINNNGMSFRGFRISEIKKKIQHPHLPGF